MIEQKKYDVLLRAFNRERQSRKEAERIIEQKALELHYVNTELKEINKNLENRIKERTKDIEKSKEELMIAKGLAEKATIAKSDFLSNMTHELRTPLNGVIGLTELVLNEKLNEDVKEMLENIKFSANHLGQVINEILDFSKIEAGKIIFEKIQFNLPKLIYGIHKNLMVSAKSKSLELKLDYDNSLPELIIGDPVKLNQILNNLVGNALKFTENGFVKISCKLGKHRKQNNIVDVIFEIKDTGIGIKQENLKGIFNSFTQSDSSISRKYGGTGLGLTITKNFVELQGGKIKVQSKYLMGSKFSFVLPLLFVAQKDKPARTNGGINYEKINAKILVVDDVVINQMVVGKILNNWGMEVDLASSGKQALHLLKKHKYDLILMDMQMPGLSGQETTIIIRNDMEYSHISKIPIIAFTASAFESSRQLLLDAGMNSFVSKPIKPQLLYSEVNRILSEIKKD